MEVVYVTAKRITKKQQKELEIIRYFQFPLSCYDSPTTRIKMAGYGLIEDQEGLTPEETYFLVTAQGKKNIMTTSISRSLQLIDAQKWCERHIKMWEEGQEDVPFEELFYELPLVITEYVKKRKKI